MVLNFETHLDFKLFYDDDMYTDYEATPPKGRGLK